MAEKEELVRDGKGAEFIFTSEEFEDEGFQASAFVSKYRRVSSMDSLKDQLREYSEMLKQQLFVIINRDYRDFIGISTKLDGVDTRVDMLRQPLVNLRLNVATLHDGLKSSMTAIDEKLDKRKLINEQRACVSD